MQITHNWWCASLPNWNRVSSILTICTHCGCKREGALGSLISSFYQFNSDLRYYDGIPNTGLGISLQNYLYHNICRIQKYLLHLYMNEKFCTTCNKYKDIKEFRANKTKKDGYQHYCIGCDKNYQKQWYQKNKERLITKAKENNIKNATEMRQLVLNYLKNNSCVHCGESNILVLEFDHLKDKKFNIAQLANKWKENLLSEMAKCQVLCANCHKIKTHEQRNTYKWRYSQAIRQDSAKILSQV